MATMSDFYLTLPSNTNEPGNGTNEFCVQLPYSIELNGQWEVALVEIFYPNSWANLQGEPFPNVPTDMHEDVELRRRMNDTKAGNIFWCHYVPLGKWNPVVVPPGYYQTPQELIDAINKGLKRQTSILKASIKIGNERRRSKRAAVKKKKTAKSLKMIKKPKHNIIDPKTLHGLESGVIFSFDTILKRVKMKIDKSVVDRVILGKHLEYVLGMDGSTPLPLTFIKSTNRGQHAVDLRGGFYSLYVYCDLVESQILGQQRVQLLQIVPTEGTHGDIISKTFYAPHYIPILKKEFQSVQISIKDDTNRLVPFEFGKCILKLHFHKRRPIPL